MNHQDQLIQLKPLPKAKVAIVGFGYWGQKLAKALVELGQKVYLVELTKIIPETGFDQLTWAEALADSEIKAVVIATPEITHAALIRAAIMAGKAVLVEKPATTTIFDWQEITQLATTKHLPVMVDYTFLQSQALQVWQQLQQTHAQELGKLVQLTSVRQSQLSPAKIAAKQLPVWWDVAIHDIYLLKQVWEKNLSDWRVFAPQPTAEAKLTAKFGSMLFKAIYGWSAEPKRLWQAEYEHGQIIWQRAVGLEKIKLLVGKTVLADLQISDNQPSPIDKVIRNWLEKINQSGFDKVYWQAYWHQIGQDIETIAQIDTAFKSTSHQSLFQTPTIS